MDDDYDLAQPMALLALMILLPICIQNKGTFQDQVNCRGL